MRTSRLEIGSTPGRSKVCSDTPLVDWSPVIDAVLVSRRTKLERFADAGGCLERACHNSLGWGALRSDARTTDLVTCVTALTSRQGDSWENVGKMLCKSW